MRVIEITKDLLSEPGEETRVGLSWEQDDIESLAFFERVKWDERASQFRLKDDDGEIYYTGWLINDPYCCAQQVLLQWAARDAGCTTIEVRKDLYSEWKQEIG
jgi:hypothetical protein